MKQLYFKYKEIINYLIFGFLTTVISILSYLLFANTIFIAKTDIDIQFATVLSWTVAVLFAYITNRIFVFESKTRGREKIKEFVNFILARIFSLLVEMLFMYIFYSLMHVDDAIAKIIVQIFVVIINYILSKIIIFKKS